MAKKTSEEDIPVNDNAMLELEDLCVYLKMDFGSYFEGYEIADDEKCSVEITKINI